jgi:glucuronate isomerase
VLHPDRLFPPDSQTRGLARALYDSVKDLPIISPHGHTDPAWFAVNAPFQDPLSLLVTPDHYILRMLYSQGVAMESLGVGAASDFDPRAGWRLFAQHYHLFRATPTALWMNHVLSEIFGISETLSEKTAYSIYAAIQARLSTDAYRPRALFDRFKIEVLATTDAATDELVHHQTIRKEFPRRIIPTFRPDASVDAEHPDFKQHIALLAQQTNENTETLAGYLNALRARRAFFKSMGATATDHGHPSALTADLSNHQAERLFERLLKDPSPADAELFRAHMLTQFAGMSLDDGLTMQFHPGSFRNHNRDLFSRLGRDKGADIPTAMEFTRSLKPLLDKYGNEKNFTLILFTLDESTYARELAPLAGHYPALRLGPAWWFHDSPEGMIRFREQTTETAGLYNTVGFNDDTRAFLSIPARHDVARRIDCRMLAQWVLEHRLSETEAFDVLQDLTYRLVKKAYRL